MGDMERNPLIGLRRTSLTRSKFLIELPDCHVSCLGNVGGYVKWKGNSGVGSVVTGGGSNTS